MTEQDLCKSYIYTLHFFYLQRITSYRNSQVGAVGIPDDSPVKLQNQETKRWWLMKIEYFQSIFTQSYWMNIFPQNASTFIVLGIYLIIYSIISLFYMQKDIRVVQIKLADRLHNLRTIAVRKPEDQKRAAKDTMEFYIPWARENNVLTWLPEMENICKQILHFNPI